MTNSIKESIFGGTSDTGKKERLHFFVNNSVNIIFTKYENICHPTRSCLGKQIPEFSDSFRVRSVVRVRPKADIP